MKIRQEMWTIDQFVKKRTNINLNPTWQRGVAWKSPRQVLLIDSVLRGMDIPKIYLRCLTKGSPYEYDAVDGQQRLRAIWAFRSDLLALDYPEQLSKVDGCDIHGKKFSELDKCLRDQFDDFCISVAKVTNSTNEEITNLFARLQMGVTLNPAELRNAMLGPLRHTIDAIATSHEFFLNCRIQDSRFKRQDYLTHAFALAAYNGSKDIKAPDLKRMISEFDTGKAEKILELGSVVNDTLNILHLVNSGYSQRITQKWIFVDLCWLIMQQLKSGASINADELTENFKEFERLRREYNKHPENLIRDEQENPRSTSLNRQLYNYIVSFRAQGALHNNLKIRNTALRAFCL